MFYEINALTWNLIVVGICVSFVLINLIIGLIRYRKIKNNKTAGKNDTFVRLKLNEDVKVNDYDLGIHFYADREKNKFVIVIDNPKSCDIYSFQSLEDYVLTVNGEYVVRSSMKNIITEIASNKITNITLDVFTKSKKYRFQILNKECKLNDNVFQLYYAKAMKFCNVLDYVLE